MAGGTAVLSLFLLVGCGSGSAPAPALPPVASTAALSSATADPSAPSTTSTPASGPSAAPVAPGGPSAAPVAPGGPTASAPAAGPTPGPARTTLPPVPTRAPGATATNATTAYAGRFCTALAPLIAFKQQSETPNMAGVTDGPSAKALAVRLLTDGIAKGQSAVQAVTDLGPAPDPQAAAGISSLLTSLRGDITFGQGLLPQVQNVDPNNLMALFPLATQARTQLDSSQSNGLSALRTSTGPAMGAALHSLPECAPLGV